jgi:hypothetical protein
MAALPKIVEEIVSGVLVVFEFFYFLLALLMEVVSMPNTLIYCGQLCNNVVNYPITPLSHITCIDGLQFIFIDTYPDQNYIFRHYNC